MNELIGMLTSDLGVNEKQAEGGAGLLFKMAQEKLGSGDFSTVASALPGLSDLMAKAPAADSGGGLLGMAGTAVSALGIGGEKGGLADLAKMAGALDSLGIDMGTMMKFAPIVLNFAKTKGGAQVFDILSKVLAK